MCLNYFVLLKSFKNMKKVLFGFICLLALSLTVSAQQGQGGNRQMPTPEESAKRLTDQFKTDFKLTDQQVPKVQEINLTFSKEQTKLFETMRNGGGGGGDFTAMREQITKLETQRGAALEKVLTKEQMDAYKKYLADRPQMGRQGGGGQGGGNRNN